MSADTWAASGPSSLDIDRVGRSSIGRPKGSTRFTAAEAQQRGRERALKWWNEVGKARRAAKREEPCFFSESGDADRAALEASRP